ncbi:unnamed protein product, partial [Ectocarpus fasciculatus]
ITEITPYLYFNGNCREAMEFYKECLAGSLDLMVYEGTPVADHMPAEARNNIMHSTLTLSEKARLMASDVFKPEDAATEIVTRGTNVSMSLLFDDDKKVPTAFDQLSAGGTVIEALLPQFWGGLFGHLEDRYGLRWMCIGP